MRHRLPRNDNKLTYQYDALERQYYEQRHDWVVPPPPALPHWDARYDTTQAYDKNGNRTGYDKNVVSGYESSYGRSENLSYTFNNVNALTQVTDGDQSDYLATVACDANGNITQIQERTGTAGIPPYNYLYTYFEYDDLNRLTVHKDKRYVAGGTNAWVWTKRMHAWDAVGKLVGSTYKTWNDGGQEPSGDSLEHIYAGGEHIQNFNGSTIYGNVWIWAGAQNSHGMPLQSPNPDTASQKAYNFAATNAPGRKSFLVTSTTEGDKREFYAQGRPMAKDSSGSGSNWSTGIKSDPQGMGQGTVESRFFFQGTVVATDMSRATDPREKGRMGIFGISESYAGSTGRVTSESLGRDLNPLGRGDGTAYVAGALELEEISPILPDSVIGFGSGNSINNPCQLGLGCGAGGSFRPASAGDDPKQLEHPKSPGPYDPTYPPPQQPGAGGWGGLVPPKPGDPGYVLDPGFNAPNPWMRKKNPFLNPDYPWSQAAQQDDEFRKILQNMLERQSAAKTGHTVAVPTPIVQAVPCNPAKQCCCDPHTVKVANALWILCFAVAFELLAVACFKACAGPFFWICMLFCLIAAALVAMLACCAIWSAYLAAANITTNKLCTAGNAWKQCLSGCL